MTNVQVLLVQPIQGTGGGLVGTVVQWWQWEKLAWGGDNCQWQERKPGGGLDLARGGCNPRGIKDNLEDPKGPMDCPPGGSHPSANVAVG